MRGLALLALLLSAAGAPRAAAQDWARAEALLASGRVAPAEAILFRAATVRPHDPEARIALGHYLGLRGALRVGAVLLEEARFFGADTGRVARELAPLYRALGDFRALVTLPGSPLDPAQRAQAAWLVSHQPTLEMTDSAVAAYRVPSDTGTLGRVMLQVGEEQFLATIDPRRHGLVLDTSRRALAAAVFPSGAPTTLGTLGAARIGSVTLGNLPVVFEPVGVRDGGGAVIGLDVLAKLAPTFDARQKHLVLRRIGRVAADRPGERLPVLLLPDGVRVLQRGRWVSLAGAAMLRTLRGRAWTFDVRRGELLLEP